MARFDNVEFRTFDFDGFKQSLFQLANNEFPDWTDTLESNQGVMFIEWLAFIAANVAYMQNFHARQCFVPTVTEAKNLTKLAKQYAYTIPSNTPATVDVTIGEEEGDVFANDVIIPAGTQIRTQGTEQLIFETTEDLTIPAGASEGTVAARHQETKTESDVSDGSADYQTRMTYGPYIEDSMEVEVDSVAWTQVDNFLDSDGTDEHFRVEADSQGIVTVIFGDGVNGKIPPAADPIDYTYAVGGGTAGNVAPNTITDIPGTFYDVNNNPVDLIVTNDDPSEGGVDREEMAVTKLRMPASLSSKEVTVDYEDFEANIQAVSGVARVNVKTVNDDENIPENTVLVVVLPAAADTISGGLETLILAALEENPTVLTQRLILANPQFVEIPIEIRDLEIDDQFNDNTGAFASATITITNNTFDAGDKITVNGVDFEESVDWNAGGNANASATALALAIDGSGDAALQDISATALNNVVTVTARTRGEHGNAYTLTETDGATNNFTLSGATFEDGEDTTVQAAIRAAVEAYFGRTNTNENGEYTVAFGETVFRNDMIWLIRDVEIDGVKPVVSFNLVTPSTDTELEISEFPEYTLKFTTA